MKLTLMQSNSLIAFGLIATISIPARRADEAHPWASFSAGSWTEVHSEYTLRSGKSTPKEWSADLRLTLGAVDDDSVTLEYECEAFEAAGEADFAVPMDLTFPGVRDIGYWPCEVQAPDGADGELAMTARQDGAFNTSSETVREESVKVDGLSMKATVMRMTWEAKDVDGKNQEHELLAWIAEGIEVPVKWTQSVTGVLASQSEIVEFDDAVSIGELSIACIVTETVATLTEGTLTTRSWSSSEVPGYLVQVESQWVADGFTLESNEKVTAFNANGGEEDEEEGNPPGSRPALGIMPEYGSGEAGLLVADVREGGPADVAGITAGDLIFEIDGKQIGGIEDYMEIMSQLIIGKEVTIKIERSGRDYELTIEVGERE